MAKPIPEGYYTITPSFTFKDCRKAIEFYKEALGAKVMDLMTDPTGSRTMHATLQIGNSIIMMGDEMPGAENCAKSAETLGNSPISLYLYVPNVDQAFKQAIAAGGKEIMPVSDMFWGDRCGTLKDPFGYQWMFATHKQDLTNDQIQKGAQAFFAQMAKK